LIFRSTNAERETSVGGAANAHALPLGTLAVGELFTTMILPEVTAAQWLAAKNAELFTTSPGIGPRR
jgi:hypothetical protein